MSFGDGDLHGKVDELARKAETYRRQLGGTQAALRRAQQRARDAQAEADRLKDVNGALCAEINRQERRIRELEALVRAHEQGMREARSEHEKRDELIRDMWPFVLADGASEAFEERIRELEGGAPC